MSDLRAWLGSVDIYLLDQVMRGRIVPGASVLDTGCGEGRNLRFFLQDGCDAYGVDENPRAIEAVRRMAAALAPHVPADNFRVEPIEAMSFPDGAVDVVISSAVLHFARDDRQFEAMLAESWRVLRPGGLFFCRLASSIGIRDCVRPIRGRWSLLPDGTQRYLVDEDQLMRLTADLRGELLDPLKTTLVQNQRAMTTWVLRK